MSESVFFEFEFLALVTCSIFLPVGVYIYMMLTKSISRDEFVVLLPETDGEDAAALLERVRHTIETAAEFRRVGVTASIGVVTDEAAESDIDVLLGLADTQMYARKRSRRNRPEMHGQEEGRRDGVAYATECTGTRYSASHARVEP